MRGGGCALRAAVAHGNPTVEQIPGRNCGLWERIYAGEGITGRM